MNIKEKFKNSLLYKFINGGTVEEQDIDTMTVSPDDAATLMALRSAEKETEASIAEYKSGVGFVVSPEIAKVKHPEKHLKLEQKLKQLLFKKRLKIKEKILNKNNKFRL